MQEAKLGGPDWYYHDIWFGIECAEITEETVLEVKLALSREEIRSNRRQYWVQFVPQNIIESVQLKGELLRSWIAAQRPMMPPAPPVLSAAVPALMWDCAPYSGRRRPPLCNAQFRVKNLSVVAWSCCRIRLVVSCFENVTNLWVL